MKANARENNSTRRRRNEKQLNSTGRNNSKLGSMNETTPTGENNSQLRQQVRKTQLCTAVDRPHHLYSRIGFLHLLVS
ncbi:hypothetical protein TNCV_2535581 [Trichonephila clavipes]|nr:hypothetical protein TNCV_2535581 [Trichonephila clavipes]